MIRVLRNLLQTSFNHNHHSSLSVLQLITTMGNSNHTNNTKTDNDSTDSNDHGIINKLSKKFHKSLTLSASSSTTNNNKNNTLLLLSEEEQKLVDLLRKSNHVIIMCGAGISTAAGIPDFRSPGTGLYSQLAKYKLPYPEAIFDMSYFNDDPQPFYQLCKEIWPSTYAPTKTHHFFKLIDEKRHNLQRVFTQNIDSLESMAGLDQELIVAAHGNFDTASCVVTGKKVPIQDVEQAVRGKISWESLHQKYQVERVKPDIVFFGENLPERFFKQQHQDFPTCDLLIIMGTSLQVHPFAGLVDEVSETTPRFVINRDRVRGTTFRFTGGAMNSRDVFIQGDTDDVIERICKELGWLEELNQRHEKGLAQAKMLKSKV
jgi:NAD-dependent SIR2 family protein deacetylase